MPSSWCACRGGGAEALQPEALRRLVTSKAASERSFEGAALQGLIFASALDRLPRRQSGRDEHISYDPRTGRHPMRLEHTRRLPYVRSRQKALCQDPVNSFECHASRRGDVLPVQELSEAVMVNAIEPFRPRYAPYKLPPFVQYALDKKRRLADTFGQRTD